MLESYFAFLYSPYLIPLIMILKFIVQCFKFGTK